MLKIKNILLNFKFITATAKCLFFGLLIALTSTSFTKKHPFYIGLTELSYTGKSELQISVRVFSNDLEDALSKNEGKKIDLLNPKNKVQLDSILSFYVRKNLNIVYNSKKTSLNYIGYEREEESVWIYMDIKQIVSPKTVAIQNTILYDYLPQQTNIIRFNKMGVTESKKLTNPDNKAEFNF